MATHFWYTPDGIVEPWPQCNIVSDDKENWREWACWMKSHFLVYTSGVGLCCVVTTFSGVNTQGGMFFTEIIDPKGKVVDEERSLTMQKACRVHAHMKKTLEKAMSSIHGEYYPSRP